MSNVEPVAVTYVEKFIDLFKDYHLHDKTHSLRISRLDFGQVQICLINRKLQKVVRDLLTPVQFNPITPLYAPVAWSGMWMRSWIWLTESEGSVSSFVHNLFFKVMGLPSAEIEAVTTVNSVFNAVPESLRKEAAKELEHDVLIYRIVGSMKEPFSRFEWEEFAEITSERCSLFCKGRGMVAPKGSVFCSLWSALTQKEDVDLSRNEAVLQGIIQGDEDVSYLLRALALGTSRRLSEPIRANLEAQFSIENSYYWDHEIFYEIDIDHQPTVIQHGRSLIMRKQVDRVEPRRDDGVDIQGDIGKESSALDRRGVSSNRERRMDGDKKPILAVRWTLYINFDEKMMPQVVRCSLDSTQENELVEYYRAVMLIKQADDGKGERGGGGLYIDEGLIREHCRELALQCSGEWKRTVHGNIEALFHRFNNEVFRQPVMSQYASRFQLIIDGHAEKLDEDDDLVATGRRKLQRLEELLQLPQQAMLNASRGDVSQREVSPNFTGLLIAAGLLPFEEVANFIDNQISTTCSQRVHESRMDLILKFLAGSDAHKTVDDAQTGATSTQQESPQTSRAAAHQSDPISLSGSSSASTVASVIGIEEGGAQTSAAAQQAVPFSSYPSDQWTHECLKVDITIKGFLATSVVHQAKSILFREGKIVGSVSWSLEIRLSPNGYPEDIIFSPSVAGAVPSFKKLLSHYFVSPIYPKPDPEVVTHSFEPCIRTPERGFVFNGKQLDVASGADASSQIMAEIKKMVPCQGGFGAMVVPGIDRSIVSGLQLCDRFLRTFVVCFSRLPLLSVFDFLQRVRPAQKGESWNSRDTEGRITMNGRDVQLCRKFCCECVYQYVDLYQRRDQRVVATLSGEFFLNCSLDGQPQYSSISFSEQTGLGLHLDDLIGSWVAQAGHEVERVFQFPPDIKQIVADLSVMHFPVGVDGEEKPVSLVGISHSGMTRIDDGERSGLEVLLGRMGFSEEFCVRSRQAESFREMVLESNESLAAWRTLMSILELPEDMTFSPENIHGVLDRWHGYKLTQQRKMLVQPPGHRSKSRLALLSSKREEIGAAHNEPGHMATSAPRSFDRIPKDRGIATLVEGSACPQIECSTHPFVNLMQGRHQGDCLLHPIILRVQHPAQMPGSSRFQFPRTKSMLSIADDAPLEEESFQSSSQLKSTFMTHSQGAHPAFEQTDDESSSEDEQRTAVEVSEPVATTSTSGRPQASVHGMSPLKIRSQLTQHAAVSLNEAKLHRIQQSMEEAPSATGSSTVINQDDARLMGHSQLTRRIAEPIDFRISKTTSMTSLPDLLTATGEVSGASKIEPLSPSTQWAADKIILEGMLRKIGLKENSSDDDFLRIWQMRSIEKDMTHFLIVLGLAGGRFVSGCMTSLMRSLERYQGEQVAGTRWDHKRNHIDVNLLENGAFEITQMQRSSRSSPQGNVLDGPMQEIFDVAWSITTRFDHERRLVTVFTTVDEINAPKLSNELVQQTLSLLSSTWDCKRGRDLDDETICPLISIPYKQDQIHRHSSIQHLLRIPMEMTKIAVHEEALPMLHKAVSSSLDIGQIIPLLHDVRSVFADQYCAKTGTSPEDPLFVYHVTQSTVSLAQGGAKLCHAFTSYIFRIVHESRGADCFQKKATIPWRIELQLNESGDPAAVSVISFDQTLMSLEIVRSFEGLLRKAYNLDPIMCSVTASLDGAM